MELSIKTLKPSNKFLSPLIEIDLEVKHETDEMPINFDGCIICDGKVVASLTQAQSQDGSYAKLRARGTHFDQGPRQVQKYTWTLVSILNEQAVNCLESTRRRNPKGDLELKVRLDVRSLMPACKISHIRTTLPGQYGLRPQAKEEMVIYQYDPNFSTDKTDMWVLSGDSGPGFMVARNFRKEEPVRIPAADWIHEFAPKLGLGKFFIIQIPEPVINQAPESLISALEEMKHADEALKKADSASLTSALNCIRNALSNNLMKSWSENGSSKKRMMDNELKRVCLDRAPSNQLDIYQDVIRGIEDTLRVTLATCVHKFLHEDTGKIKTTPLRGDVEYAYLVTLSAAKYLSELLRLESTKA